MQITRGNITKDINVTQEQLDEWQQGGLIQNVMPHLTADEREFIMTGITSEEWDSIFASDREYRKESTFVKIPVLRGKETVSFLLSLYGKDISICGGFVRWMCSPNVKPLEAHDIDIYPKDMDMYEKIKNDMLDEFKLEVFQETEVAITFKTTEYGIFADKPPIQLVKPFNEGNKVALGTLEEILDNFDFTVIRIGLLDIDNALADKDFLMDEGHNKIAIRCIHCPISSTLRVGKYRKKGYSIGIGEVLKLFTDWEAREDAYKEALIEGIPKLLDEQKRLELSEEELLTLSKLIYID